LDTPELIEAWIAERKKRFPTSTRVEDKKKKLAEAMERGQLDLNPSRLSKRRKTNPEGQRLQMHGSRGVTTPGRNVRNKRKRRQGQANVTPTAPSPPEDDKESDDDEAIPEEFSSRIPHQGEGVYGDETISITPSTCRQPQEQRRLKEPQPRGPPKNPFASRSTLLRNVSIFLARRRAR